MKQESATPEQLQSDLTCLILMAIGSAANGCEPISCLVAIQKACRLARAAGLTEAMVQNAVGKAVDKIPTTLDVNLAAGILALFKVAGDEELKAINEYAARN